MAKIKILDESISNIIAAGEVVENPASMIKELLENSLDAGANKIVIDVLNGGKYVKISDNGSGMSKEDVLLSIERHATSKISKKEDIFNLSSYGFRGEALASISSVSKLSITSKTKDEKVGTILNSYGGNIVKYEDFPRQVGTEIEIRDLFYNTPARKKFLRKDITEYIKIKDVILKMALINYNVSITLTIDGKQSLKTSGNGIDNTIFELFGKNVLKNLSKFSLGYLGNNSLLRSSKDNIYIYVNNRYVKSTTIDRAVIDAYYTKLIKGKYPFVILKYDINPKEIDVNVHPSKKIIKFSDDKFVYEDVKQRIEKFFYKTDKQNWTGEFKKVENNIEDTNLYIKNTTNSNITEKIYENPFFEDENDDVLIKELIEKDKENEIEYFKGFFEREDEEKVYNVIGQIFDTYILVDMDDTLEIYDQHIIHERLLYEELKEKYSKKEISYKLLLIPEILEFTVTEIDLIMNNIETFNNLGFEIDQISEKKIALRKVPDFNFRDNIVNILYKIIDDLKVNNKVQDIRENILISMSCKGAIKAGQKLSMQEMQNMVKKLHEVGRYTCPHGRPIISRIRKYDFDKMFGRVK